MRKKKVSSVFKQAYIAKLFYAIVLNKAAKQGETGLNFSSRNFHIPLLNYHDLCTLSTLTT